MSYSDDAQFLIAAVFGNPGLELIGQVHPEHDDRARVEFDETRERVFLPEQAGPVTELHEFAHLYHIVHFRAETLAASDLRCEAVACTAEFIGAHTLPCWSPTVLRRTFGGWQPEVFPIVTAAVRNGNGLLHDNIPAILRGDYG